METNNNHIGSGTHTPVITLFFSPFRTHDGRRAEEFVQGFVRPGEDKEKTNEAMREAAVAEIDFQIELHRPQLGKVSSPDVAARSHLEKSYDAALEKESRLEERLNAYDQDTPAKVKQELTLHSILYALVSIAEMVIFGTWFDVALPEVPGWVGWVLSPLVPASTLLLPRLSRELSERWQKWFRVGILGLGIAIMFAALVLLAYERKAGMQRLERYEADITEQQLFDPTGQAPSGNEPLADDPLRIWTYLTLGVAGFFIAGGLSLYIKRDLEAKEGRKRLSEQLQQARNERDAIYSEWSKIDTEIERKESYERQAARWKTQEMVGLDQIFSRMWAEKEEDVEFHRRRMRQLSGDGRAEPDQTSKFGVTI